MADDRQFIKQIKVGGSDFDLNVYAIQDTSGNPKTWSDITALVSAGFTIIAAWTKSDYENSSAPSAEKKATVPAVTIYYADGEAHTTGTLAASDAETKKHIYLIYHKGHDEAEDVFDEYVSAGTGASSTWEKVGNTDIDLSDYAKKTEAAKAGTYTTVAASGNTGSAGAATISTSEEAAYTATGTATITYQEAATATGSAHGGTTATTSEAAAQTINGSSFTFTGTTATITSKGSYQPAGSIGGSQTVNAHSHTVNISTATAGVITAVDANTGSAGAHTHDVDSHTHGDSQTVIKSTGLATTTISAFSTGGEASLTTRNYGFTSSISDIMYAPTVSAGVLQWSATAASSQDVLTFTPATGTTATIVTGVKSSGGTVSVAGAPTAATLTAKSAGAHSHSIGSTAGTITYVNGATLDEAGAVTISGSNFTFTGTTATITSTASYQPAGSLGGSATIAAHSHTYTAPANHTHSISLATTTVTGTVEVGIAKHHHTVTIADHTHTLGNHTHSVTIPAIDPGA